MRGVQTSFPRRDEVELQWAIVDPLLMYWAGHPPDDFPNYPAGSMGPKEADDLLRREGRQGRTDRYTRAGRRAGARGRDTGGKQRGGPPPDRGGPRPTAQ